MRRQARNTDLGLLIGHQNTEDDEFGLRRSETEDDIAFGFGCSGSHDVCQTGRGVDKSV